MEELNQTPVTQTTATETVTETRPVPPPPTVDEAVVKEEKIYKGPSSLRILLVSILIIIALLLAFQLGIMVGYRKASTAFVWSASYHQVFAGPGQGFLAPMNSRVFVDAHGISGIVLKNEGTNIIIDGKDDTERNVLLYRDTLIRKLDQTIPPQAIVPNDRVVIIGETSLHGEINARFIRVLPTPQR